jgi:hypothetical protein
VGDNATHERRSGRGPDAGHHRLEVRHRRLRQAQRHVTSSGGGDDAFSLAWRSASDVLELRLRNADPTESRSVALDVAITDVCGVPRAYSGREGRKGRIHVPGVASFHFEPGQSAVTAEVESDEDSVVDAYCGMVLPLALQAAHGLEVVHASGVKRGDRVVVFSGISESGKSTIARGFAGRGCEVWADEAIAFRVPSEGLVTTVALPFRPKLRPESRAYFVDTAEITRVVEWSTAPLTALFVLDRRRDETRAVQIERLSVTEAFVAVLPNGYRFRPLGEERERQMILSYLELVAAVPIFRLTYELGLERLPEMLDSIEDALERMDARPLAD